MRLSNDHLKRKSYLKTSESIFDDFKNLGYNYKGNLFRNSLSSLFYLDDRKVKIINLFDKMIYYLIENVKTIKLFRNYAMDKNSSNIN